MQHSSNQGRRIAVAVMIATALAGCNTTTSDSAETATLAAVSPSTETGTATLTNTGSDTTEVAITTAGGRDTGVESAVIRSGTRGSSGSLFALLNDIQENASTTTIAYALSSVNGGSTTSTSTVRPT